MVTTHPTTTGSQAVQDFLKAVYTLQQEAERASTSALAEMLSISAPSVTDMARRLTLAGLVDYEKYRGVRLTESGEQEALRVIRRHRLIELYLVTELGYAIHEVHDEAERLEHAVSDRFVEAVATRLGNPTVDPHGDQIPGPDGLVPPRQLQPLVGLPIGARARVAWFASARADMLQHLMDKGFALGSTVEIVRRDPFDGPLTVLIDGQEVIVGYTAATHISVEPEA